MELNSTGNFKRIIKESGYHSRLRLSLCIFENVPPRLEKCRTDTNFLPKISRENTRTPRRRRKSENDLRRSKSYKTRSRFLTTLFPEENVNEMQTMQYADNLEKLKSRRNTYTSHRSTSYGLGRKRNSGRLLSIRSEGDVEKEKAGVLFE
ncbi:Hypothetical predicted protein, partial [Mytilus galloprovincialis]